jgi:MtaA/CmuA family methyltransferase
MNAKQRLNSVMDGKKADRIPNMNIIMQYAAKQIGVPYSVYCKQHEKLVEGNIICAERYGLDCVTTMSDPMKEASAFGAEVIFPEDGVPYSKKKLLADESTLLKLTVTAPCDSERMSHSIFAIERYKRLLGDDMPIIGWVEGCLAEAADLRGVNELMYDLIDDETFVCDLMDLCLEQAVLFAKAQIEAGADIIGVGDAIASVVGPVFYQKFALPYEIKLLSAIRDMGAKTKLHICGNTTPFLEYLPADYCDIIDVDWMVPLDKAAKLVGDRCALSGNYDPVAVMMQGTTNDVRDAVVACSRAGVARYISAAGCEVPKAIPEENFLTVAETLKELA